jgi:hypothetical protein
MRRAFYALYTRRQTFSNDLLFSQHPLPIRWRISRAKTFRIPMKINELMALEISGTHHALKERFPFSSQQELA